MSLDWTGIQPTQYDPTERPYCPECGQDTSVTLGGRTATHAAPTPLHILNGVCRGSGMQAREADGSHITIARSWQAKCPRCKWTGRPQGDPMEARADAVVHAQGCST